MIVTQSTVRLSNPGTVLGALQAHMAEHGVEIREIDNMLVAVGPAGEARLRAGHSDLSLEVRAESQSHLETLTGFLASHVLEFAHPETPRIEWSGLKAGAIFSDFREIEVTGVEDLTAHMRRVTFKGGDIARFDTDEDLHVRLFFPPHGHEPLWPVRGVDGLVQAMPLERKPAVRKYTIRHIDSIAGTLDIDFVLHEVSGPGSDWAKTARPGARIGMAGPGGRSTRPADWTLLAGDETAMPAVARILENLPSDAKGQAILVVDKAADAIEMNHPPGFQIDWVYRRSSETDFVSAVLGTEIPSDGTRFCWAGAEFAEVQAIRHHWRNTVGLSSSEQLAVAYWRKGQAES